jgi:hypothetical protein
VPEGEKPFDGGFSGGPGHQQVRVAGQQEALVERGEAAAGHDQRRLRQPVHGVQQGDLKVVLAEGRRDAEDVRGVRGDPFDDVAERRAQLHVDQRHGPEQGGAGGARHVADPEREPWQWEVFRVVQSGQQQRRP